MLTPETRAVFDLLPDGVITADDRGSITYVNPAIDVLLGWPRGALLGKPLSTIVPERLRALHEQGFRRYIETREPRIMGRAIRVPALRVDGAEVDIELTLTAYPQANGCASVVAIVRDLRERVELERQLELARYLGATTHMTAEITLRRDLDHVLQRSVELLVDDFDAALARVWLYDAAERQLRLRASAGLSRRVDGSPRAVIDVATSSFKVAVAARMRVPAFSSNVRDDAGIDQAWAQREGLASYAALPLVLGDELVGVAIAFFRRPLGREIQDILTTVARVVTTAIADAQLLAEHQEALRAKDDFLAMLGHELRNPLAPIVTALELIRARGATGFERERGVIERQAKHLVQLVDDLLDIARLTKGKVALGKAVIEIARPLDRALEMTAPLVRQHRHRVSTAVPASGLAVCGDETRLAQVFANLLTNAARYTPDGGEIDVRAEREGDEVVVRVRDNGKGIDRELLPRLFELFVQGPRTVDRQQGGLGIGLALVRSFVGLHGGTVVASSAGPGQGSELTVRLPLHHGRPRGVTLAPARAPAARRATRVLVVDDNEDAAVLLSELLVRAGYEVQTSFDPESALAVVDDFTPDAAILDIGLPGMDGYELGRRLRARMTGAAPRLIALTGYGQAQDRERSRDAGFAAHLVKPLDRERLLAALQA